ncbi:serine/threonine-protein kinase [Antrihabitans sp. YC2-6]|uniref:serine/threonine-protein kinase n=1 Tax=Antrihabitans sp. YC2-6 TaxID=2799498 RepID=UPI0018F2FE58|nr:serine/threonine-protein kinase [Antrihabitans sp. YC2-6]MBJ8346308.1 protein kinase [Antrihabitans sp. YC2-6]
MSGLEIGSVVAGHRIEGIAGQGGMGVVYRARHLALNRPVAMKVIAPDFAREYTFRERFKRESELAAALEHPNIVPIYHAGQEGDLLYVTMRYINGTDLGRLLETRGRLPAQLAIEIISQIGSALDAAHAHGLVHRDVKPANILIADVQGTPRAYLTDFGLTKSTTANGPGLTQTGIVMGSMDYIAPEQIQGYSVDARCDVYELGCVLFHTLTGQVPYPTDTITAKMWGHMSTNSPSIRTLVPGLPEQLDRVVKRSMALQPENRFGSTGEFAFAAKRALPAPAPRTVVTSLPPGTNPAGPHSWPPTGPGQHPSLPPGAGGFSDPGGAPPSTPSPTTGRGKKWWLGGAAAVVSIAVVVGALMFFGRDDKPVDPTPPEQPVIGAIEGDPLEVGLSPRDLIFDDRYAWIADFDGGAVYRIDPTTRVPEEIKLPEGSPSNIAVGSGQAWVQNYANWLTPVNVDTKVVGPPHEFTSNVAAFIYGDDIVWSSHLAEGTVTRFQATDGTIVGSPITVGEKPSSIAYYDRAVYVLLQDSEQIVKIHTATGTTLGDPFEVRGTAGIIDVRDGVIYTWNSSLDKILRFDSDDGDPLPPLQVGKFTAATLTDEYAFVVDAITSEVRRYDLATGAETGKPIGGLGSAQDISDMAVVDDELWVVDQARGNVIRIQLKN